jgi:hypothetical protein
MTAKCDHLLFPIIADPIAGGFVDSLARPGGNATGFMLLSHNTLNSRYAY